MAIRPPEGYAGNLNEEQTATLDKLKENLASFVKEKGGTANGGYTVPKAPEAPTDAKGPLVAGTPEEEIQQANNLLSSEKDLLRFCRARQFDAEKATEMALNNVKWRASVKPWAVTPDMIPTALPSGVWRWAGYTKSGMSILHVDCANWKPSEYYSVDEYIRYLAYIVEGAVQRMGDGVSRLFVIYWIPGLTMEMMGGRASECAQILMKLMQDQYPERLGAAMTCNCNALFSAMWAMCQGWIDPVTKAKFQVAPKGMHTQMLLKYIDADVLPKSLGGNHEEYPCPSQPLAVETASFLKDNTPPVAKDVSALAGCSEETILNGAYKGEWTGLITVRPGNKTSIQVHLEPNTKSVSWSFAETRKYEVKMGYKVTGAAAPARAAFGNPMAFGGGSAAAALVAAKGATILMNEEPAYVGFADGPKKGKVDVQANWAGGTLNLLFDNTEARLYKNEIEYTLCIDAADLK